MKSKILVMTLMATSILTACKGGGGGGGGVEDSGWGSFTPSGASVAIGAAETCGNYTMTAAKCSAIGGTSSSFSASAGSCTGATGTVTNGNCLLDGMVFTLAGGAVRSDAEAKCEALGGELIPNNFSDCDNANGTWRDSTSVTSVCSVTPDDASECSTVGGTWAHYRSISGSVGTGLESIDPGIAYIFSTLDESNSDYISVGTRIISVSGLVKIKDANHNPAWTAPAPLSRASDFKLSDNGYLRFDVRFGKEYGYDESVNGIDLDMYVIYRR